MGTGIHNAKVEGIKEGGELPRLCNFIAESAIRFLSKLSCRWRRSYRAAHQAEKEGQRVIKIGWRCPRCAVCHEDYIPESFIRQKKAIFVEVTGTEGEEA